METALTPGILTSLPGRYAKALFDLAWEKGQIESVGSSLRALKKLIQSSEILRQVLANPTVRRAEQAAVLSEICGRMKAPEVVQSFVEKLVKGQRMPYLPRIEAIYQTLVSQAKGEQLIEITSAYPLTSSQKRLLKDILKKDFPNIVKLTFVNDSKVLGGLMIRAGSHVIDVTLATQLHQLATVMKGSA